ncbi:Hypothetical predicted protein, partial [Marmota monax]
NEHQPPEAANRSTRRRLPGLRSPSRTVPVFVGRDKVRSRGAGTERSRRALVCAAPLSNGWSSFQASILLLGTLKPLPASAAFGRPPFFSPCHARRHPKAPRPRWRLQLGRARLSQKTRQPSGSGARQVAAAIRSSIWV